MEVRFHSIIAVYRRGSTAGCVAGAHVWVKEQVFARQLATLEQANETQSAAAGVASGSFVQNRTRCSCRTGACVKMGNQIIQFDFRTEGRGAPLCGKKQR